MKNNGGAAFPIGLGMGGCNEGMSLRDYFAAAALPEAMRQATSLSNLANASSMAYEVADAMLKEREKE